MRRPSAPLFLARDVYRKRRLRDAARLVPILGMFLLILPVFWSHKAQTAGADWVYVLAIWAGLIGLAALLAPGLSQPESGGESGAETDRTPGQITEKQAL